MVPTTWRGTSGSGSPTGTTRVITSAVPSGIRGGPSPVGRAPREPLAAHHVVPAVPPKVQYSFVLGSMHAPGIPRCKFPDPCGYAHSAAIQRFHLPSQLEDFLDRFTQIGVLAEDDGEIVLVLPGEPDKIEAEPKVDALFSRHPDHGASPSSIDELLIRILEIPGRDAHSGAPHHLQLIRPEVVERGIDVGAMHPRIEVDLEQDSIRDKRSHGPGELERIVVRLGVSKLPPGRMVQILPVDECADANRIGDRRDGGARK